MSDLAPAANLGSAAPAKGDNPVIRKLFLVLHGSYGSLFTAKFSTGERDSNGKDKGIRAAMLVWDAALSKYPPDVIETAALRLGAECPEFPPNLPQFEAICKAVMPSKTYAEDQDVPKLARPEKRAIGHVDYEVKHDGRDWARKLLARHQAGDTRPSACVAMARAALGLDRPGSSHVHE